MPYVFISTQIRLETGPTVVGDEWSDKELMTYLGAELVKALGNNFLEYRSADPPRVVLDKLEKVGYKVVACCGIGQTCIWTLHKPDTATSSSSGVDNSSCSSNISSSAAAPDNKTGPNTATVNSESGR